MSWRLYPYIKRRRQRLTNLQWLNSSLLISDRKNISIFTFSSSKTNLKDNSL